MTKIRLTDIQEVTAASGGLSLTMNKAASTDNAIFRMSTAGSARMEFGLRGSDDTTIRVSPDGSSWTDALLIDKDDGFVTPRALRHFESGQRMYSLMPLNGIGTAVETYRINATSTGHPRSATISSVSGDVITLTTSVSDQFFHSGMAGFSMVRIWNMSKGTPEPAWLVAAPASNQLQVLDSASISGWAGGETVQIGDEGTPAAGAIPVITIDISPAMIANYGTEFRQAAVAMSATIINNASAGDGIDYTPTAVSGSATGLTIVQSASVQSNPGGGGFVQCTDLSPVSNSNLLRIREKIATTAGLRLVRTVAVFV